MRIVYFFDVLSPYSALSWRVLRRYQTLWGIDLVLKPIFLGGVMQATGNKPPATLPARANFQADDLARSASHFSVPLLPMPSNFFTEVARSGIACQRLICAAQLASATNPAVTNQGVEILVDSLTTAFHLDPAVRTLSNELKIDQAFITGILLKQGLDKDTMWTLGAGISTPEAKGLLKANTAEAVERGVFGSPTMLVSGLPGGDGGDGGEQLFFGSDRFEQLAFLAGKPWYGPNPAARPRL